MLKNVGSLVADISDDFERCNTSLKKEYLKINISKFNEVAGKINFFKGTFGTGYPFYVIDRNFNRELPIISEQLRYNDELRNKSILLQSDEWKCEECLRDYGSMMADLKCKCKPCPNIDNELKPRKVINRLGDLDMWFVCEDGKVNECSLIFEYLLSENGFSTSDKDPVKTINDFKRISDDLKNGKMPSIMLPIDTHIIEESELTKCIINVRSETLKYMKGEYTPYVSIHPLSLRKKWQKDDTGYNFVHDFLNSFTEYNFNGYLEERLLDTRRFLVRTFDVDTLYDILKVTGVESTRRRHQTPELEEVFKEKVMSWKK